MPPSDTYFTSTMSVKEKKLFEKWYTDQVNSNYTFNFKEEIISYCISDVQILREALESFRKLFMETAEFDPLTECLTLSSACMANFRKNHLGRSRIGIVPRGGYRGRQKSSIESLEWLDYESDKLGQTIQTNETSGEKRILNRYVDGYAEVTHDNGIVEKRIYQYHGCYFHLCIKCIPDEDSRRRIRGKNPCPYERTKQTTQLFRSEGYTVIEKWACDFAHDRQHNPDYINFFKNYTKKRTPPLNLRDAICGGRTSALYTHLKAKPGQKIKFYDVCSEYPHCQYKMAYPEGHPTIFLENDPLTPPVEHWNGVLKATVLPPSDLYLPVLPYKCNSKLMFPLCRTCAETMSQDVCSHTDEQRMLTGTWCAPEMHLALKKNIKLLHYMSYTNTQL
ncbi:putative DNA polymerase [Frankliniella fusca]|uniref:DNA-directed DNA polymerase n=1 Tax=Frankliniella fusca TaxID=407009 RepID=A0AAE1HGW3_9NEOP|nr:putative DNA polymerase [Frankliniella fusca]